MKIPTREEGDTQKREERTYLALECRLSRALAYFECSLSLRKMTSRTYITFFVTEISRISRMFKYNLQRLCPVFQRFCAWEGKNEASFHKDLPRTFAMMTPRMKERRSSLLFLVCLGDNGDKETILRSKNVASVELFSAYYYVPTHRQLFAFF